MKGSLAEKQAESSGRNMDPFDMTYNEGDEVLDVDTVSGIVNRFAKEAIDTRVQQVHGAITARERGDQLLESARRVEDILYGRVAGYATSLYWSPNGLGLQLAARLREEDPVDQVSRRLMHLALDLGHLYDEGTHGNEDAVAKKARAKVDAMIQQFIPTFPDMSEE